MLAGLKVTVLKNGSTLQILDFESNSKSTLMVGRSEDADIRIDDRAVGRSHAVLHRGAGGDIVLHKKTEFGKLQVNGADVNQVPMKMGDIISIADYQLRLESKAAPVEVASAASHPLLSSTLDSKTPPQGTEVPQEAAEQVLAAELPALPQVTDQVQTGVVDLASVAFTEPSVSVPEIEAPVSVGEGDRTAMTTVSQLAVKLVFKPGEANVEDYEIKTPEISVGRGSSCEIVIEDKKASRKHCIIKRIGGSFILKDLGSANGTFVNGIKVSEQELSGEDIIRIGATEFAFKATNQDYFMQESQGAFLAAPQEVQPPASELPEMNLQPMHAMSNTEQANPYALAGADSAAPTPSPTSFMGGVPGMEPGAAAASTGKKSLMQRYRDLPKAKRMRVLIIGAFVLSLYAMSQFEQEEKEDAAKLKAKQAQQSNDPKSKEFSKLPKEKREFIEQTYTLTMDYFTRLKYEQAIFEADKILEILPNGFKDVSDIKSYAQQGVETLKAQAEEEDKKRKDLLRKENIMKLVTQAQEYFNKGMEAEAKEVFSRILELDPDNPVVAKLKASIEEKEQKLRMEEDQKRQIELMREAMKGVIAAGKELMAKGLYYQSIDKFTEVPAAGTDAELLTSAKELIALAKKELIEKRQPHIDAGNAAYDAKEYEKSRNEYRAALDIDPRCNECDDGIARIRRDVHERAQKIYIEAIIAESVSDLATAKKKYIECFKASVPEDDYYGRCWRKFHRFNTVDQDSETEGLRAPAEALREDPYTKEILEFL